MSTRTRCSSLRRPWPDTAWARRDIVRKAMGKKIPGIMQQERDKFIEGALNQGYDKGLAEQVFDLIEPFAGYALQQGSQR